MCVKEEETIKGVKVDTEGVSIKLRLKRIINSRYRG